MEPQQRALIKVNLPQLLTKTEPSTLFLAILESRGILGSSDIDELVRTQYSNEI